MTDDPYGREVFTHPALRVNRSEDVYLLFFSSGAGKGGEEVPTPMCTWR